MLGYDETDSLLCARMRLPARSSGIQILDCANVEPIGAARYRGSAFAGELTIPGIFSAERPLFVKLERRSWFFDEAGWLEVSPLRAEQIAAKNRAAAERQVAEPADKGFQVPPPAATSLNSVVDASSVKPTTLSSVRSSVPVAPVQSAPVRSAPAPQAVTRILPRRARRSLASTQRRPYRAHCRAPCFAILQSIPRQINGALISDIIPTFGMVNYIAGECER